MSKKEVKAKLRELVEEMFSTLRDEIERPLTWDECRFINDLVIVQVQHHRENYKGM